jgi:4-alpha-glucanotransferase
MGGLSSWTIERDYIDAFGHAHAVAPDDLECIMRQLGGSQGEDRTAKVLVSRQQNGAAPVVMDHVLGRDISSWEVVNLGGGAVPPASHDAQPGAFDLPIGSYRLRLRHGGEAPDVPLLVAPGRAYQPEFVRAQQRRWVWSVQLYAVRSRRNWGIGDFTDLLRLLDFAATTGAGGVGINPLHVLHAGQSSPYSPSSRRFLSPLYIDLDAVPEFGGAAASGFTDEISHLRTLDMVDYAGVEAVKRAALRQCHQTFRQQAQPARREAFERFRLERGDALAGFAAFELLKQRHTGPWWEWPAPLQKPSAALLSELRQAAHEELEFHEYVQWVADDQLRACRDRAQALRLPIGLYLDLAVGVDPNGADVWGSSSDFSQGLSVGAPPDAWNPAGQSWGIASFHPQSLIETDFAVLRQTLRSVMRYAGAIRIDHALGLNRMFLIPEGRDATHGAYVRFPFEAMLAVVAQESVAHRCLVIGEDLGTVPEGVSEALRDWGVWSYRVALFERHWDGRFRDPGEYPADAIVTFSTHDLPTFTGWMTAHDLKLKAELRMNSGEGGHDRGRARDSLREAFARNGIGSDSQATLADLTRFLARTPSRLLAVAIDDALAIADQTNIPGTVAEHPNWMRRLPVDLEELAAHENVKAVASALEAEGRATTS